MGVVVVIAPHPDDETLGCGGAILKHISQGDDVYWLIMTSMHKPSFTSDQISTRDKEIKQVAKSYGFRDVFLSKFPAAGLDIVPKKDLVSFVCGIFDRICPEIVYLPHPGDIHSDHEVVFAASSSCTKSFRHPYIRSVRVYETLSETEFNILPETSVFRPNLWIDVMGF